MDPSLCLIFYNLSPFKFIPENNFSKISHGYQCGGQVHTCTWTQKCACISHPSAPKHTHTYTHRVIVILFLPSAPVLRTTEKLRCSKEESYNKDFFCTKHSSECWGHLGWCDPEMKVKVTQSCLTLCDPVDYTVHGILQSVALPFSRRSSQPRDQTQVSCTAGRFFTVWVTREACDTEMRRPNPAFQEFVLCSENWNTVANSSINRKNVINALRKILTEFYRISQALAF